MKQYKITTNRESIGDPTIPDAFIDDNDEAKKTGGVPGLTGLPPFFRTVDDKDDKQSQ